MKIQEFEQKIQIGNLVRVGWHIQRLEPDKGRNNENGKIYAFMGYEVCNSCDDTNCPGRIKLSGSNQPFTFVGCYRNGRNIRLEILDHLYLSDDLFEI